MEQKSNACDEGDSCISGGFIRGLIEDFIQNVAVHKSIVDELCVRPVCSFIYTKISVYINTIVGSILTLFVLQILMLLVLWDTRKLILAV